MDASLLFLFGGICFSLAIIVIILKYVFIHFKSFSNNINISPYIFDVLICVFFWYTASLGLTFTNKWIISILDNGFSHPLLLSSIHTFMTYLFTRIYMYFSTTSSSSSPQLSNYSCLLGVISGLDIALSTSSLRYISVTLYTIVKSTSLLWIYLWGCVLKLETLNYSLLGVILIIGVGVVLVAMNTKIENSEITTNQDEVIGLVICLIASCLSGIRWVITEKTIRIVDDEETEGGEGEFKFRNSFLVLFHSSKYTFLSNFALYLVLDLLPSVTKASYTTPQVEFSLVIFTGGIISICLIFFELSIVSLTSSLALGILGSVKEALQVLLGLFVFHDDLKLIGYLGLSLVLIGSSLFKCLRRRLEERKESDSGLYTRIVNRELEAFQYDEDDAL